MNTDIGNITCGNNTNTISALDVALWAAVSNAAELAADVTMLTTLGFNHERRMTSALVRNADGTQTLVTKGAPEVLTGALEKTPEAVERLASAA